MISLLQEGAEGVKSGSDFSTISLGVTQFLKSLTRNSPRLVLLEVSKVDTLFSISDSQQLAQIDARGGEGVRILPSHYDHIKQQHQRCLFRSLSLNFVTAIAPGGGGN